MTLQEDKARKKKKELFSHDEIVHGKCLGHGGFADVYEVRSFCPHHEEERTRSMSNIDLRKFFEEHAKDDSGHCKYAIKTLSPQLEGTQKLLDAEKDISSEAALLSSFDHPNIVKVYSYAGDEDHTNGATGPVDSYFLIMDKLSGTLDDRIARWRWQKHRLMLNPVFHAKKKKDLLIERLEVAYEIACAMAYLHDERVVYRDLKSSNVGFDDANGHVKLFDFGLARKLPDDSYKMMTDSYQMSGKVGSCPYMAPEVFFKKSYNEKVDVYSFSLILWEILDLHKAFIAYAYDRAVLSHHVFVMGERPPIRHDWPLKIKELLPKAWSQDWYERPSMQQISITLKKTIAELRDGDYSGLEETKSRESKHIFTSVKRLMHKPVDTNKPSTTES